MVTTIELSAFATVLAALAICLLFFPAKVQTIAVRAVTWGMPTRMGAVNTYMRFVTHFVRSNQYRICVRLVGLLSLSFALFVVWLLVMDLRGK